MMGKRFSKAYLGTIWLLLSLGTVLYLVDLAEQLAEQRVRLEAHLQQEIDSAQATLDTSTANWQERTALAKTEVAGAKSAVNEFITPEIPEPSGWSFRRAQKELKMAKAQLEVIVEASEEELAALNEVLVKATANKPAQLTRFDEEEALQVKDWVFAFSGLVIGGGLLLVPVSSAQPGEGGFAESQPEPPPAPAPQTDDPPPSPASSAPVMRARVEESEEEHSELELEPVEDDY
jgi:exonuclease VII small subunit